MFLVLLTRKRIVTEHQVVKINSSNSAHADRDAWTMADDEDWTQDAQKIEHGTPHVEELQ